MSQVQPPTQLRGVMRSLLLYLREHPEAKDTLYGVTQWWLGETTDDFTRTEVQEALDWLTETGCLTARKTATALKIYGLNKTRIGNIEELLITLNK